ncbi:MAG: DNA repair protein RecN [Burkholderiales bacterium]|nr:DNA repair protein RecN [Burkholderiales bacterium]
MLRTLSIRDFVIVASAELEFSSGFTVLTGETGAGKSVLIDALALALGERADGGIVRSGCDRAEICAEFEIDECGAIWRWLCDNDLTGDPGVCLMRRAIDAQGRSRGFINGRACTLAQMREAGELLVDIHGQHAHQSLLKPATQRELLDGYGGLGNQVLLAAAAYRDWCAARDARRAFEADAATLAAERDGLAWQARELAGLQLVAGEWQELNSEHARLAHAASLLETAQFGIDLLSETDGACLTQLSALSGRLTSQLDYDAALNDLLALIEPARIQLQEAVYFLRHYQQRLDLDPERLARAEQRVAALHSAGRKFRVSPEVLPEFAENLTRRLATLTENADGAALGAREAEAERVYADAARKLSVARRKAARELSGKVTAAMRELAMAGGRFDVALTPLAEPGAYGSERIEFLVATQTGGEPAALGKIASGGELSRISLAIQTVTSQLAHVPTLIFDEVDAGIGGRVAEMVGRMLHKLGREHQAMCITHLPQVAAAADRQWQVVKTSGKGAASCRISLLDEAGRTEEIARMLGGVKITDTTRRHAEEMLKTGNRG